MAGIRHDVVVLALKEKPGLLAQLVQRVHGARVPGAMEPADSAVRFAASLETHPDILFTTNMKDSSWLIVEVQNRKDERKAKSWHLATSTLLQRHGMGDLIVITASRAVAEWALTIAHHRGELGTEKGLKPVVLHLSRKEMAQLLDPSAPELAPFAVWARCRGDGPEARQVLKRALELTEALPAELREPQTRAILAMLGKHLLEYLREMSMDVNKIPETKASREFRLWLEQRRAEVLAAGKAEGLAEGKRASLLAVLAARGLTPSPAEQEQITSLVDPDILEQCVRCAVTATTVAQALAPLLTARKRTTRSSGPRRPRTAHAKKVNGHHR